MATADPVRFTDARHSGLAAMLGQLISQNLARDPSRRRLLGRCVITIEAPDSEVAVTLRLEPGSVELDDGLDRSASVAIRADSDRLLRLVGARLRFGFPDVFDPAGRAVVRDLFARRVVVRGLLRHPRRVARLTMLLSVHEDRPRRPRDA